jgi:glutaredoxin-related protein
MSRQLLDESAVHGGIQSLLGGGYDETVNEVKHAVANHAVVVVGMAQNPVVKKARKNLNAANQPYQYLEYGSYVKEWHRRLAIKMWSGWPTFPMVFVKGQLIGGNQELEALIASGELKTLLES